MQAATRIHTNESDTLLFGLYAILFIYHAFNRAKSYRGHHKYLPWHVLAGTTELTLYFCNFNCTILAVITCYIHSLTSLSLVKRLPNGYPPHTRPIYQGGAILRMGQILQAYTTQNPIDYYDAIVPLHSFIYARAIIGLLGTMGPSQSFAKNVNSRFVYAEAIFGGALIAVGHCTKPSAMVAFLLSIHAAGKVSTYAGRRAWEVKYVYSFISFLLCRFCGAFLSLFLFGRYSVYETLLMTVAPPDEVPPIGTLPMDKLGHHYARLGL
ncbi:hypothetical protein BDV26DRAFT_284819 [Aspergillus bertholletiae]|uniref:Uncharacterized protein n=1 Tax=Aspergillus bertholletiae TaxID=1226010 RepID=A0A5N7AVD6_9EURO|nr:hypothetical protein BDV26DRAFT_284819 [Aspergillus bertholletiae]